MLSRMRSDGDLPRFNPCWRLSRDPHRRFGPRTGTTMRQARSNRLPSAMTAESPTIAQLAGRLRARAVTSEAVTRDCLAHIADRNGLLNAFITVLADDALEQARAADREIASGRYRGPLHGVPLS